MPITLDIQVAFGLGLQALVSGESVPGTPQPGLYWAPMMGEGETFQKHRHTLPIRQLGARNALSHLWDPFCVWAGTVTLALLPNGAYMDDLFAWLAADPSDADNIDAYEQARWATIAVPQGVSGGHHRVKAFYDAKVVRSVWRIPRRGLVTVEIDIAAVSEWTSHPSFTPDFSELTWETTYLGRECTVTRAGSVTDTELVEAEWEIDNKVIAPRDGMRVKAGEWPAALANLAWPEAVGRFARVATDNDVLDEYLDGTYDSLTFRLERDSNYIEASFYNVRFMPGSTQDSGGAGRGRKTDTYRFAAEPDATDADRRAYCITLL